MPVKKTSVKFGTKATDFPKGKRFVIRQNLNTSAAHSGNSTTYSGQIVKVINVSSNNNGYNYEGSPGLTIQVMNDGGAVFGAYSYELCPLEINEGLIKSRVDKLKTTIGFLETLLEVMREEKDPDAVKVEDLEDLKSLYLTKELIKNKDKTAKEITKVISEVQSLNFEEALY